MSLLALPNEILIQIIRETTKAPRSFEALILACSKTHELGREFLSEHNDLRKRFRRFRFELTPSSGPSAIRSSLDLLRHIAAKPVIAAHIEEADLHSDQGSRLYAHGRATRPRWKTWRQFLDFIEAPGILEDRLRPIVSGLVSTGQSSLKTPTRFTSLHNEKHNQEILPGLLLLSLLENVREVTLPHIWTLMAPYGLVYNRARYQNMLCLLDVVADRIFPRVTAEGEHTVFVKQAYKRLSWSKREVSGLALVSMILLMPHLSELHVQHCVSFDFRSANSTPFYWHMQTPPRVSSVSKITLTKSDLDTLDIAALLRVCPRLISFCYSHWSKHIKNNTPGEGWDACAVLDTLANECGDRLTSMSLTAGYLGGPCKGGVRSLHAFKKLTDLALDVRLFFGPEVTTDELKRMTPTEFKEYASGVGAWNAMMLPNLVTILPPTLRNVHLTAGPLRGDIWILKGLCRGLDEPKIATALPLLNELRTTRILHISDEDLSPPFTDNWRTVADVVRSAGGVYDEEWIEQREQRLAERGVRRD